MRSAGHHSMRIALLGLAALGFGLPAFQPGFAQAVRVKAGEGASLKINSMEKTTISKEEMAGVETIEMDELGQAQMPREASVVPSVPASAAGAPPLFAVYPRKVREIAAGLAQENYPNKMQQDAFVAAFQEGFRSVLAAPHESVRLGPGQSGDPTAAGFARGCNLAVSNAAGLDVSLLDYGYAYTNAVGHIFLGFEQREFRPLGGKQVWWLAHDPELGRAYADLVRQGQVPAGNRTAIRGHFFGYLSPAARSGYGHLGGYAREMVIDKFLYLKLDEPQP